MKYSRMNSIAAACLAIAFTTPAAAADCRPVKSDVVGLGQQSARSYSEKALQREIDGTVSSAEASGGKVARPIKRTMVCKPFTNVLGADEWECFGAAKVCVSFK